TKGQFLSELKAAFSFTPTPIVSLTVWRIEKKRNLPIKTYKLLTIKLLYSMFLINYYIGAFVWK
uniref:hypothetical protein n=1 Tax=Blautia wexlerae TaxID=418240 RepID=UPI001A9C14ED